MFIVTQSIVNQGFNPLKNVQASMGGDEQRFVGFYATDGGPNPFTIVRVPGRTRNPPVTLHLEDLWIRNVTITTGLVDTYSTETLLRLIGNGQLDAGRLVTHHFHLDEMEKAYGVFGDAANTGALKVVLTAKN